MRQKSHLQRCCTAKGQTERNCSCLKGFQEDDLRRGYWEGIINIIDITHIIAIIDTIIDIIDISIIFIIIIIIIIIIITIILIIIIIAVIIIIIIIAVIIVLLSGSRKCSHQIVKNTTYLICLTISWGLGQPLLVNFR